VKDEHREARDELIGEIVKAVRQELRVELILAAIGPLPQQWPDVERSELSRRLRAVADELDPPVIPELVPDVTLVEAALARARAERARIGGAQ
jgi:hypothetical protein